MGLENKKSDQENSSCPDLIPPSGEISQPLLKVAISHSLHLACRRFPSSPIPPWRKETNGASPSHTVLNVKDTIIIAGGVGLSILAKQPQIITWSRFRRNKGFFDKPTY